MEIPVCPVADFKPGARHLVKAGTRNIAVYNVKGRFFALDNACYHHGGPLLEGEIETMGGHLCVICPWHSYRIALDTGEGLYVGLCVPPGGGKPIPEAKSKGPKQRTHPVIVRDGMVVVCVGIAGTFESDVYASMALANREEPTKDKAAAAAGNVGLLHSSVGVGLPQRSGQLFGNNNNVRAFGVGTTQVTPPESSATVGVAAESLIQVRCVRTVSVSADGLTKMFVFDRVLGPPERLEAGEWVTLRLPSSASVREAALAVAQSCTEEDGESEGQREARCDDSQLGAHCDGMNRTWTLTSVRAVRGGWFTLTIRKVPPCRGGRGGSAWMHAVGPTGKLQVSMLTHGGEFCVSRLRERINQKRGLVLMLSAGIGITPMIANIWRNLLDPFIANSGPPLHMALIHSERALEGVPHMGALCEWHREFAAKSVMLDPVSFCFQLLLTQPSPASSPSSAVRGGSTVDAAFHGSTIAGMQGDPWDPAVPSAQAGLQSIELWRQGFLSPPRLQHDASPTTAALCPNVRCDEHLAPGIIDAMLRTRFGCAFPTMAAASTSVEGSEGPLWDVVVMVCGPPTFMTSATEMAAACGVPRRNIICEAFNF